MYWRLWLSLPRIYNHFKENWCLYGTEILTINTVDLFMCLCFSKTKGSSGFPFYQAPCYSLSCWISLLTHPERSADGACVFGALELTSHSKLLPNHISDPSPATVAADASYIISARKCHAIGTVNAQFCHLQIEMTHAMSCQRHSLQGS